jgi:hypothetical protein
MEMLVRVPSSLAVLLPSGNTVSEGTKLDGDDIRNKKFVLQI